MSEGDQAHTRGRGACGEEPWGGGGPVERAGPVEQGGTLLERGPVVRAAGAGVGGSRELYRETKDVTEEAAATLRNISTNFLSSLKYKKVTPDDGIAKMRMYFRSRAVSGR